MSPFPQWVLQVPFRSSLLRLLQTGKLVQSDESSVHTMATLVYRRTLDPVAIHYKIGKKTIVLPPAHKPRPSF
ncbi:BZ3500_MvSof-1268-A1-R1_Chr1-2g01399 [Microbotryum saponariae]|uniref:BZ3500_MvSof-1268-A1-R1_Chr1-2g01399 protein n=1 Tax=Microbotryum saponariae TaxID=289078 RepID=A0A2X0KDI5_9BASI|nr:BZ3500_MvSof-1268-A1-R1_Chr1-2g01399 [Microbotryum saponariae]SCZ97319.1 BZ3501_MvSof-1269-A2-R1_Chr1-2g00998 [Microbotryum saponariae]